MIDAFFLAISPSYLMFMTIGVLLGLVVGTLPGLTATMGTALLVPYFLFISAWSSLVLSAKYSSNSVTLEKLIKLVLRINTEPAPFGFL